MHTFTLAAPSNAVPSLSWSLFRFNVPSVEIERREKVKVCGCDMTPKSQPKMPEGNFPMESQTEFRMYPLHKGYDRRKPRQPELNVIINCFSCRSIFQHVLKTLTHTLSRIHTHVAGAQREPEWILNMRLGRNKKKPEKKRVKCRRIRPRNFLFVFLVGEPEPTDKRQLFGRRHQNQKERKTMQKEKMKQKGKKNLVFICLRVMPFCVSSKYVFRDALQATIIRWSSP